jgi:hypothetical protein
MLTRHFFDVVSIISFLKTQSLQRCSLCLSVSFYLKSLILFFSPYLLQFISLNGNKLRTRNRRGGEVEDWKEKVGDLSLIILQYMCTVLLRLVVF